MTEYLLSPKAQADIDDIWNYTAETWGVAQAVAYIGDIRDACMALVRGERLSRPVTVREGYHKSLVGSHSLYFRRSGGGTIIVIRILHQSMDVERHL